MGSSRRVKFAGDVVAGREGEYAGFEGIVDEVFAAVGQQAVGVGIAGAPIEVVALEGVFAGELAVVGGAAAVIVFGVLFVVVLGTDAGAVGIAVGAYLVEDVFEFKAVVVFGGDKREVEHGTDAGGVVELVVLTVAQVVAAVVLGIIGADERIFHVEECLVAVAVIEGTDELPACRRRQGGVCGSRRR